MWHSSRPKKAIVVKQKYMLQGLTSFKTQLTIDGGKYVYVGLINDAERFKAVKRMVVAAKCKVHNHYHGVLDVYPFTITQYKNLLNKHGYETVIKIVELFKVITDTWGKTSGLPGSQWKGSLTESVALNFSTDVTLRHKEYYGLILNNFELTTRIYDGPSVAVLGEITADMDNGTLKSKIVAEKLLW